ncbi:hypothetical protein B0T16DRAFT_110723 [Cercophora newfieldiana]|uniref:Uncharacterized protein n=1 Tax=Cercophora newfieldiana TaxID=92897 RepID=A0AA40CXP2_9PEZI|nr:hypothetical protein B0T16DRAFT_110723 [Cercophora newfieldiana]
MRPTLYQLSQYPVLTCCRRVFPRDIMCRGSFPATRPLSTVPPLRPQPSAPVKSPALPEIRRQSHLSISLIMALPLTPSLAVMVASDSA